METLGNQIMPKLCPKYFCESCDYKTSKKSSYDNHLLSSKHKNNVNFTILETNGYEIMPKLCSSKYQCQNCDKNFKNRSGLWKHKQICNLDEVIKPTNNDSKDELIEYLIKENKEIKDLILELAKKDTYSHCITNNNNNSHNKTFNLQFFLNETCKDAMNIMDFVNSIQLQLSDLESVGKLGFVEGISNIITTNLKALDITQRPVHCTDNKREVMYIKDDNKWEKEDEQKVKLRKAIKKIATKNLCLVPKFKEAHPDCNRSSSRFSDQYNKIIIEACGGSGNNDLEKEDKIIRNIAKNVTIDKKMERIEK
jgi:hypothetical protein